MTTKILTLRLKAKWWNQIKDGTIGRHYDEIHLWCGYPPKTDATKLLRRRWRLVAKERILHEEFGPEPVEVFCIDVGEAIR